MTSSSDRLGRVEALIASIAEGLASIHEGLASIHEGLGRTEKIVESNARAIEAWGGRIDEVEVETEEATRADLAVRIEDNAHNQGIDRVRFDQLHEEHAQRFNNLLEEARADRQRADRDRALNESEHQAFRETSQTMLAEIARLWQRETD